MEWGYIGKHVETIIEKVVKGAKIAGIGRIRRAIGPTSPILGKRKQSTSAEAGPSSKSKRTLGGAANSSPIIHYPITSTAEPALSHRAGTAELQANEEAMLIQR